MVYGIGLAHHGHTVAILEHEVIGGKQLDVAAHHTADVHAVSIAQMKGAEHLAVEHRTGHDDHTTLHMRVDGVPVDLLAVPVFLHLLAKQDLHGVGLMRRGHHQQVVVDVDLRLCQWHDHAVAAPDA